MDAEDPPPRIEQRLAVPEGLGRFEDAEGYGRGRRTRLVRDGNVQGVIGGPLEEEAAARVPLVHLTGGVQEAGPVPDRRRHLVPVPKERPKGEQGVIDPGARLYIGLQGHVIPWKGLAQEGDQGVARGFRQDVSIDRDPARPQARVVARIISGDIHARRFCEALRQNIKNYEARFGPIKE